MTQIRGVSGYANSINEFVRVCQLLDFREVCKDTLDFLPAVPGRVLDIGAGAGQNANALAKMGYVVTAIEPMIEFLTVARNTYDSPAITWCTGHLPALACLDLIEEEFEFILVEGVWQHLDESERVRSLQRMQLLLKTGGRIALSLRSGPAGLGTCIFPTNLSQTIQDAKRLGLHCLFQSQGQPSAIENKENVKWSRVVFEKTDSQPLSGFDNELKK